MKQMNKNKKGYVSKRLKCKYCEKKFNKQETFDKHVKEIHKIGSIINEDIGINLQENSKSDNMDLTFQRKLRSKKIVASASLIIN